MQVRQVICPSCRITLQVPAVYAGVVVRCSKCKGKFRLPKPSKVSEDTITSWLSEGLTPRHLDDDDLDAPPRKAAVAGERPTDTSEESAVMIAPPPADTVIEPVRLVKFGDSGALMEFQASRLREVEFRTAMPRHACDVERPRTCWRTSLSTRPNWWTTFRSRPSMRRASFAWPRTRPAT